MEFQSLHENFKLPTRGSEFAGGLDIYMPEFGSAHNSTIPTKVGLGFAAEVPLNHVGLLLPRSGVGSKMGLELNNTCGVMDSDYRGEWIAKIRTKGDMLVEWEAGERMLQMLVVPVAMVVPVLVDQLGETARGIGGFGHSGK